MGLDTIMGAVLAVFMFFTMKLGFITRVKYVTTINLHRGHCHDALLLRYVARLWGDYSLARVGMWQWYYVYAHVRHHANTDTEDDPHPPWGILDETIEDPLDRWQDATLRHVAVAVDEYRDFATEEEVRASRKPRHITFVDELWQRLPGVKWVWLVLTHQIPYVLAPFVIGAVLGLFGVGFSVNMVAYLPMAFVAGAFSLILGGNAVRNGSAEVNSFGHGWPVRSLNKAIGHASNHQVTARKTAGEGRQFDHHARQRSARIRVLQGTTWRDDTGWEVIKVLRALRLTRYVNEDPNEPPLPERRELDHDGRAIMTKEQLALVA